MLKLVNCIMAIANPIAGFEHCYLIIGNRSNRLIANCELKIDNCFS